jgi:DnaJ-class molecular chaperone
VPAGTAHGARLALPGAGVPRAAGGRGAEAGDHVFRIVVVVPRLVEGEGGGREGEALPLLRRLQEAAGRRQQQRESGAP